MPPSATAPDALVATLLDSVRIPSVSLTGEGIGEAVEFLAARMERWGFEVQVFPTASQPIVYGEIGPQDAPFTWLTYGHYDVYPADAKAGGLEDRPLAAGGRRRPHLGPRRGRQQGPAPGAAATPSRSTASCTASCPSASR